MGEEKEKKKRKKKKESVKEESPPPVDEEPEPPKKEKSSKKKSKRQSAPKLSGALSIFSEKQLAEFKEGFNFIDHGKDGIIDKEDLRRAFDIIGKLAPDHELDGMLNEAPAPISFTMMLTMFAERMSGGSDEDDTIIAAFKAFDMGDGSIDVQELTETLSHWGDKFTDKECKDIFSQLPLMEEGPNAKNISIGGVVEMLCSKPTEEDATATESEMEA